ncbi:16148_t:CDS:2 [Gigaspora rosea]|nr:16148_t:CDS:2 [Gigaspora rosea]
MSAENMEDVQESLLEVPEERVNELLKNQKKTKISYEDKQNIFKKSAESDKTTNTNTETLVPKVPGIEIENSHAEAVLTVGDWEIQKEDLQNNTHIQTELDTNQLQTMTIMDMEDNSVINSPEAGSEIGDDNKMETKSVNTIRTEEGTPRTYSQILAGDGRRSNKEMKRQERSKQEEEWIKVVTEALAKQEREMFDEETWDNDKIVEAFESLEKLEILDTAFFRTFTRNKKTKPPHQLEYQQMYGYAIDRYREMQGVVIITNKTNRDQVHAMLKIKLMTDYFKSIDMVRKDPHEIAQDLFYGIGFAAIKTQIKFENIPESWVDIKVEEVEETGSQRIPLDLEGFQKIIKQKEEEALDLFPVTSYEKLPEAIEILTRHFQTTLLPPYLNKLQDLPKPV